MGSGTPFSNKKRNAASKGARLARLRTVEKFSFHGTYFMDAGWDAAAERYVQNGEITSHLNPRLYAYLTRGDKDA